MGHYEYFCIDFNGGMYEDATMEKLGEFLEVLTQHVGFTGEEAIACFIDSGLARFFERQNPCYVAGMSGAELVQYALDVTHRSIEAPTGLTFGFTVPFWIGEMAAYFQLHNGMPYKQIFKLVPYERFVELYYAYGECAPAEFAEVLKRVIGCAPWESNLKIMRKNWGFTQAELACRSGVSLRAIQQYEQGVKDIRKASADAVLKLSMALDCAMEDLL